MTPFYSIHSTTRNEYAGVVEFGCSSAKHQVQSSLERVFLAILVLDPFDFEIFSQNGKGRKEGIKGHT
jgi:hypothetical protein